MKRKNKSILPVVLTIGAILLAYGCRMIGKIAEQPFQIASFTRTVIYLALFIAWGVSLKIRIQQERVQKYMLAADLLIVFWIFIRSVKFYLVTTPSALRYLWYLYYLPMLFIPLLSLLVALSIDKPDSAKPPKRRIILWLIPTVLFLFVMTNDLHQLVFTFPQELSVSLWSDKEYGYQFLSRVITVWEVICPVMAYIIMTLNCRMPGGKKFFLLPALPLALIVVYLALYGVGFKWFFYFFGDMTIVQSLLIVATFESCIRLGLIPSNSCYALLFDASLNCSAQIADLDFQVQFASADAKPVTKEQIQLARNAPLRLAEGQILHTSPISGGYTVWIEDHSELLALAEELEDIGQELEERNNLLRYEYKQEKKRKEIEEQNKLYDLLQTVTQKQLDKVAVLVNEYQQTGKNAEASHTLLAKIAVLCSFIKRRKHLELLVCRDFKISVSEIRAAFEESLRTLSLLGVSHSLFVDIQELLSGSDATDLYDFFEDVTEAGLDSLRSINVRAVQLDGRLRIAISLQCNADLSALRTAYPTAEFEKDEDEWSCLLVPEKGGDGR